MLKKLTLSDKDAERIQVATIIKRSSTEKKHRGHGLGRLRKLIENNPGGKLTIISRYGEFSVKADGTTKIINHLTPIEGTFIHWQVSP